MPTLFAFVRFLGLQGLVVLAAFIFYEGVPAANYVTPYLRFVPALGPMVDDLAQGRVGRAREGGRLDERLIWQERQRRADLKRDADRRQAQAEIDAIERDYWSRQAADALKISELEKTLEEDPKNGDAAGDRPALSRRVRDAINPIGRY
ncbi:MAG TPA: hypothetical protein VGN93_31085 [Shinella sp.]|jgi:hypothetical protein|uniref:hypothetical protein n=1 Tax=Shinella sp. TaxID=1870904 RepID=UPI002E105FEB|nr:hypothetical protein [Shinella sp.]